MIWLVLIWKYLTTPDALPLLGIYNLAGKWYWLKFYLMKFVIQWRQKKSKSSDKIDDIHNSEFGAGGKRIASVLDKKQKLDEKDKYAADAVFFDASNSSGWYFTLGTAQRVNDVINLFFILRIPNVGTFVVPEMLKDTNVKSVKSDTVWKTESGFTVTCVEPMRKWTIEYQGLVVKSPGHVIFTQTGPEEPVGDAETIPLQFHLEWTNFGEYFDFDQECSPTSIAHSLALEPWSRPLFDKLKASHQTHYEQFGTLSGNFVLNDKKFEDITMKSMRDHTIAKHRNWSDIRRYIMMIYHLEDGTCIHTSVISMPGVVFTQLEFGYIITPDKKKIPVDRIHFSLPHHGEDKNFPTKFHYTFEAGPLNYDVDVEIIDTTSFKMGLEQACQVNENMATFEANGIKGYGFAEVEYRIHPY